MSLYRAIFTVGGFTMISRVTGFLRDIMIAALLGAGPIADAFFVAFKLPNFFRRLTAEGSFTVAFIPLFAGLLEEEGRDAALRFAAEVVAVLTTIVLALTLLIEITMPWVMIAMAPGFVATPDRFDLAVELTRLTFPYLPFISLVALLGGMLNSVGRFAAVAAAPILLNLILITAMATAAHALETPGHVLAWGVATAGLAQFLWLVAACRREGLLPRLAWSRLVRPRLTPGVHKLFRLMVPALLGAGVVQVNLLIDVILASTLPTGSISFLYYADRVNQLPLGVIGVAVGTALLPMLTRQLRAGEDGEALTTQNRAFEFAMLLCLPAAAGLMALSGPIVAVLFERGAFDATASSASAMALMAYAFGLPAFVAVKVFQPGFFAREDTRTPVFVSIVAVAINLVLNLILMQFLAHVGLALATAIASWANAAMLIYLLRKRNNFAFERRTVARSGLALLAATGMAVGLVVAVDTLKFGDWASGWGAAAVLAILIAGGMVVYFSLAFVTGAARPRELREAFSRRGSDSKSEANSEDQA